MMENDIKDNLDKWSGSNVRRG